MSSQCNEYVQSLHIFKYELLVEDFHLQFTFSSKVIAMTFLDSHVSIGLLEFYKVVLSCLKFYFLLKLRANTQIVMNTTYIFFFI